jgi:hypothetical protein
VKWRAFPAECTTPVSPAEAERIAWRYLVSDHEVEEGYSLVIEEYEICFTVRTRPKPQPVSEPMAPPMPPEPGQSVTVIDKETGGVTFWPSWAMHTVAEAYKEANLAGNVELLDEWPSAER